MTPPKKRLASNKPLPKYWRLRRGVYWYRVPDKVRHLWDGKREYPLGKTLADAHQAFSRRMAENEAAHSDGLALNTMADVFDHYLLTVLPLKKPATQFGESNWLGELRQIYGDALPTQITSKLINKVKHATAAKRGPRVANKHLGLLSHVCTMMLEWGLIDVHPMIGKKVTKLPVPKRAKHIPSDAEIEAALELASPMIRAYVEIKIRTGLRMTDMLKLRRDWIRDGRLQVPISKTRDGDEAKVLDFELTDDLAHWIRRAQACNRQNVSSMLIFQTRTGGSYIDDNDRAGSFTGIWQRWQKKVEAAGMARFAERYLRNKVGHDVGSDEAARELLGHDSVSTTRRHYRPNASKVTPLKRPT